MYAFLLLIAGCVADFKIWSPDDLSLQSFSVGLSNFGDGSLITRFGKLIFIQYAGDCSFLIPMSPNSFAIIYNFSSCSFEYLAQSVQNSGGSAMIFVSPSNTLDFIMSSSDLSISSNITITSFSLTAKDGDTIQKYSSKEIWASYSYALESGATALINYQVSSNYTLDRTSISQFANMASRLSPNLSDFSLPSAN